MLHRQNNDCPLPHDMLPSALTPSTNPDGKSILHKTCDIKSLIGLLPQHCRRIFRIGKLDIKVTHRHGQYRPDLHLHKLLADAVARAHLERTEDALAPYIEGIPLLSEPPLGQELAAALPEVVQSVLGKAATEQEEAISRVQLLGLVGVSEEDARLSLSGRAHRWIQTQRLFDDSRCIRHLI